MEVRGGIGEGMGWLDGIGACKQRDDLLNEGDHPLDFTTLLWELERQ